MLQSRLAGTRTSDRFARSSALPSATGWITLARLYSIQRSTELFAQFAEITFNSTFASDQHMVGIGQAMIGQKFTQQRTKSPFHPVADNRVADLFRHGNPEPLAASVVPVRKQHKTGPCNAQAPIRGKKIRAASEDCQRRRAGHRLSLSGAGTFV